MATALFTDENRFDREIDTAVRRWSASYGVPVPAWFVKSIIARESSFRLSPPMSPEPTGDASHGLMRVREATARSLGFVGSIAELHKPGPGILYGVKYLAQQLKRYRGDYARAAAAYNAGPGNVKPGGSIPNPTYVTKVLQFANYFKRVARVAVPATAAVAALAIGYLLLARRRRAA
jgi:transglycosylase-like protein with SLT domain